MHFRPLKGEVIYAEILQGIPSFVRSGRRRRGKKGVGLRYEAKCHKHFAKLYDNYVASPWFRYATSDEPARINYAQPDGLLIDLQLGLVTIVEIKYSHCSDAYFQLVEKYLPIVKKFFNNSELWDFATVEVVNWYDFAVVFPTTVKLRPQIDLVRPNELAVHICRPKR